MYERCDQIPSGWPAIDYGQKIKIRDVLNKELERQELPTVREEIFNWRMAGYAATRAPIQNGAQYAEP